MEDNKIYKVFLQEEEIKFDFPMEVNLLMEHMERKYGNKMKDAMKHLLIGRNDVFNYSQRFLEKHCVEERKKILDFQMEYSKVDSKNLTPEIYNKAEKLKKNLLSCSMDFVFTLQNISKRTFICQQLIQIPLKRCLIKANDNYKEKKDLDLLEKDFERCYKNVTESNIPVALRFEEKNKDIFKKQNKELEIKALWQFLIPKKFI